MRDTIPAAVYRVRVARPALPRLERYAAELEDIWERSMLSNDGPTARAFERAFARHSGGAGHALAASSCDLALTLALAALELPRGSHALVASFGFPSSVHALEWNGLVPRLLDVDTDDWCLHAEQLEGRLDGVSVIVATHMFGVPCDVVGLEELAAHHRIALVFDAAQAVASRVGERHVTDFGDASAVSFSATKVVTAGEGAIATFRDGRHAKAFRLLRSYGIDRDGVSRLRGLNAKLSELHAALGLLSLEGLAGELQARERLVARYRVLLGSRDDVRLQRHAAGNRPTPVMFAVDLGPARERVRAALAARGIETRPYFPPLHRMERLARNGTAGTLPVTERLGAGVLALPLYSDLEPEVVEEVCEVLCAALDEEG